MNRLESNEERTELSNEVDQQMVDDILSDVHPVLIKAIEEKGILYYQNFTDVKGRDEIIYRVQKRLEDIRLGSFFS